MYVQQQIVETAFAAGFFLFGQRVGKIVEQLEAEQGKGILFGFGGGI